MENKREEVIRKLSERNEDLEDAGIRPDRVGAFVTVLTAQNELDLPFRIKTAPAAATFLQSFHTGHSEALQQVRSDELLAAIFEDLHAAKLEMTDVYSNELKMKEAGELDEEDLALTETLGRRIGKLGQDILTIAEMRENSNQSFDKVKAAATTTKELEKEAGNKSKFSPHFPMP